MSTDANEMNTKQDVNVNTHSEEIEVNSSEETNLKGLVDQKTDLAESDPNKKTNENGDDIHILADVPYTTNEV